MVKLIPFDIEEQRKLLHTPEYYIAKERYLEWLRKQRREDRRLKTNLEQRIRRYKNKKCH